MIVLLSNANVLRNIETAILVLLSVKDLVYLSYSSRYYNCIFAQDTIHKTCSKQPKKQRCPCQIRRNIWCRGRTRIPASTRNTVCTCCVFVFCLTSTNDIREIRWGWFSNSSQRAGEGVVREIRTSDPTGIPVEFGRYRFQSGTGGFSPYQTGTATIT